jgi:hypothetical protein
MASASHLHGGRFRMWSRTREGETEELGGFNGGEVEVTTMYETQIGDIDRRHVPRQPSPI